MIQLRDDFVILRQCCRRGKAGVNLLNLQLNGYKHINCINEINPEMS